METILKAYSVWDTVVLKEGVDEKKAHTMKAMIFQTLPGDILMQVAQYKSAKEVWDAIKVRYLGADMVQKARLQTLRSELEALKMGENKTIRSFAMGRITAFEERLKSQNEPENNNLLIATSDNHSGNRHHGKGCGDQNHGRGRRGSSFRGGKGRGRNIDRGNRDKSELKCCECSEFGHFAYECSKQKDKEKEKDEEAHLALEEEPMLLQVKQVEDL
ncbi:uncharacterized protein LOC110901036 [Helianthus annuus]|uniref:uncharacterized protein LOC110901036 n=1 Tax=Helianthus annuus TaxID=4232 RepID=UPI000B8FFF0C|nr:uncharacterized protein LOC110901036 [Helianthus annuus]